MFVLVCVLRAMNLEFSTFGIAQVRVESMLLLLKSELRQVAFYKCVPFDDSRFHWASVALVSMF